MGKKLNKNNLKTNVNGFLIVNLDKTYLLNKKKLTRNLQTSSLVFILFSETILPEYLQDSVSCANQFNSNTPLFVLEIPEAIVE